MCGGDRSLQRRISFDDVFLRSGDICDQVRNFPKFITVSLAPNSSVA